MKAIELLDFGTSRLPAVCGLYIDVFAIRPFAHVFEIKENAKNPALMTSNIPQVCSRIAYWRLGGLKLDDIDWRITSVPYDSRIRFSTIPGAGVRMDIANKIAGGCSHVSLTDYTSALNSENGFEFSLTSGHGFSLGDGKEIYILRTPLHPRGFSSLQGDLCENNILLHANRFRREWKSRTRAGTGSILQRIFRQGSDLRDDETLQLLNSTPENSSRYMPYSDVLDSPYLGKISYIPRMVLKPMERGTGIYFSNGRHRSANLLATGAQAIPVHYIGDPDNKGTVLKRFGYRGHEFPEQISMEAILRDAPLVSRIPDCSLQPWRPSP